MLIRNDMQHAASTFAQRLLTDRKSDREWPRCRCTLCRADITALALSMLPPRYSTVHSYDDCGVGFERNYPGLVGDTVIKAMVQIKNHPKHHASNPGPPFPVTVRNFTLEESISLLDSSLPQLAAYCSCDGCRADVVAFALNRISPRYGVECGDRLVMPADRLEILRRELRIHLIDVAPVVAERPRSCVASSPLVHC